MLLPVGGAGGDVAISANLRVDAGANLVLTNLQPRKSERWLSGFVVGSQGLVNLVWLSVPAGVVLVCDYPLQQLVGLRLLCHNRFWSAVPGGSGLGSNSVGNRVVPRTYTPPVFRYAWVRV